MRTIFYEFLATICLISVIPVTLIAEPAPKDLASVTTSPTSTRKPPVSYIHSFQKNDPVVAQNQLKVESYFSDIPEMVKIANCESGFKQFYKNGKPVVSPTGDFGTFQINAATWDKVAKQLGLDYKNSFEDNLKMARYVYEQSGINAWTCAKLI